MAKKWVSIGITEALRDKLRDMLVRKHDTYDALIWKLLKNR